MSVNKVEVNGVEHEIHDARLNPLSKTPQMTTPVGVNASGRLYAQPSSSEEVEAFVGEWLTAHPEAITEALEDLQPKAITDAAGYFTTDTVEGALQEIGAELAGINTLLGSGVIT